MQRLGPIELADGVQRRHAVVLWVAAFVTIGLLTFVSIGTPYVLNENLRVPLDEQGRVSASLVVWTEVTQLLTFTLFGVLADRIGRRQVYALGFLVMALGYALYPFAHSTAELSVYRVIYAVGIAAVTGMLGTVVNDYPRESSRGRFVAITGMLNGLGIVVLSIVFGRMPVWLTASGMDGVTAGRYTHLAVAAVAVVSASVVAVGLKPGLEVRKEARPPIRHLLRIGLTSTRNPRIALAYASAFVARGDLVILGTFTNLWGQAAALGAGHDSAAAMREGKNLFIAAQLAALIWAGGVYFLIDRLHRVSALALCMGLAAVGYSAMHLVANPLDPVSLPLFALLGIGQISAFFGATALIGQEAPLAERASVIATFSFCGALGILVTSKIGGYLYDHVGPSAPFVMVGALNLLVLAAAVAVRVRSPGAALSFPRSPA